MDREREPSVLQLGQQYSPKWTVIAEHMQYLQEQEIKSKIVARPFFQRD
jgi:hypothetical protein